MAADRGTPLEELVARCKEAEDRLSAGRKAEAAAREEAIHSTLLLRDLEYCLQQGVLSPGDNGLARARQEAREARRRLTALIEENREALRRLSDCRSVLSDAWQVLSEAPNYPVKEARPEEHRLEWVRLHEPEVVAEWERAWAEWEALADDRMRDTPTARSRIAAAKERLRVARERLEVAFTHVPV